MLTEAVQFLINKIATACGCDLFEVSAMLGVILVCAICGAISPMVVGSRMAFFSDAMAHCAFAGVTLGMLTALVFGHSVKDEAISVGVMVGFGVLIGVGIAYVRDRTALASDTVIGVFFAGAIGFGAVLYAALVRHAQIDPELFLFGSPLFVGPQDLLRLLGLAILTGALLVWRHNQFVFASFNPSLARSRQMPLRLYNYVFIVLLALVVNLSIRAVGVLLINALLVVPAATASNVARNLRQMFWISVLLSLTTGVLGLLINLLVVIPLPHGDTLQIGAGGMIVVLSVACFFLSMALAPMLRRA